MVCSQQNSSKYIQHLTNLVVLINVLLLQLQLLLLRFSICLLHNTFSERCSSHVVLCILSFHVITPKSIFLKVQQVSRTRELSFWGDVL